MNLTNLLYKGNVKIKLLVNNKILEFENHNEGLPALRLLFAKMLTREKLTNDDVPVFIDLRDENENTQLVDKVLITDRIIDMDENYSNGKLYPVTFKSVIAYNNLLAPITNRTGTYRLYLCSTTKDLSRLNISGEILSSIGPGVEAIVEWVMKIENKPAQEQNS